MNFASAEEINGERLIQYNPVTVLKEKRIRKSLKPRETYIEEQDLWKVIRAIECLENQPVKQLLLLLLSTGLRLNEAASLEWDNIKFNQKYFVVFDTKNHSGHVVPMSRSIEWTLKEQRKCVAESIRWLCPSSNNITHVTDIRKSLRKVCINSGVSFTPHDLRRTFATIAHCCGLDHTTIKRVMNHKHKDITEQYIQTKLNELRQPLQEIDDYIDEAIINYQRDWEIEILGYARLESDSI
jgi:integrase